MSRPEACVRQGSRSRSRPKSDDKRKRAIFPGSQAKPVQALAQLGGAADPCFALRARRAPAAFVSGDFRAVRFAVAGADASFRAFGFDLRPRASAPATAGARARSSWRSNASVVAPRASMFLLNALLLSAFDASSLALLSAGSIRLCAASGAAVRHSAAIAPTTPGSLSRALAMRIAAKSSTKEVGDPLRVGHGFATGDQTEIELIEIALHRNVESAAVVGN